MNLASILVTCDPKKMDAVIASIDATDFAEVHHHEPTGRMIIVIEGANADEDVANIEAVKRFDGVYAAEMLQYYFEEEMETMLADFTKDQQKGEIPRYLTADADDHTAQPPNHFQALKKAAYQ